MHLCVMGKKIYYYCGSGYRANYWSDPVNRLAGFSILLSVELMNFAGILLILAISNRGLTCSEQKTIE